MRHSIKKINIKNTGLVYVFTGDGKGKTSAALGTALRAVGNGMTVAWVAWYKQASWRMSEIDGLEKLGVQVFLMGKGFHIKVENVQNAHKVKTAKVGNDGIVVDTEGETEHVQAAKAALAKAGEFVGEVDVLILDEVNNAVEDSLINLIDLINLISKRSKTHLILTGRGVHPRIVTLADLVSEIQKIKHPYDKGELAVKGLDF